MSGISNVTVMAAVVTALYGVISIVGGFMGYRAGSTASIIAGGISGVVLLACAAGAMRWPVASLVVAGIVGLALAGRFLGTTFKAENLREYFDQTKGMTAAVMISGGVLVLTLVVLAAWTESQTGKTP